MKNPPVTLVFPHICEYCGKSYSNPQKSGGTFCSHYCYIRYRFYADEDIETVIAALRQRKPLAFVPYWIQQIKY